MNDQRLPPTPVAATERIASLDVLRGFALCGILLLNILGFGLASPSYFNPGHDVQVGWNADFAAWAGTELFAEGAMRCLFSMLFGAGVLLFVDRPQQRRAMLHYRRTFWLLGFGLLNTCVLVWYGDILVTYALAGALLFLVRRWPARRLFVGAAVLIVLLSVVEGLFGSGMIVLRQTAWQAGPDSGAAAFWETVRAGLEPDAEQVADELAARRDSYGSAFAWNMRLMQQMWGDDILMLSLWDALAMMLLGMALLRCGVLQGERSDGFYCALMAGGLLAGLAINGREVMVAVAHDMDVLYVPALNWTYQSGRLGMALGYLGLVMLMVRRRRLPWLAAALAATGRLALTNYLLQSLLCLMIFTGAGLALVGELSRAQLYPLVLAIWAFQMLLSLWWTRRYRFGPLEWLWRVLTYGRLPG